MVCFSRLRLKQRFTQAKETIVKMIGTIMMISLLTIGSAKAADSIQVNQPSQLGKLGTVKKLDLSGTCGKSDYSEFGKAKAFARGRAKSLLNPNNEGLGYNEQDAISWSWKYVGTHSCGTIGEFKIRFFELFTYANGSIGLNPDESREYALSRADRIPADWVHTYKERFDRVFGFVNDKNDGIGMNEKDARIVADKWATNEACGDGNDFKKFVSEYRRHNSFAYHQLNFHSRDAHQYALNEMAKLNSCVSYFKAE